MKIFAFGNAAADYVAGRTHRDDKSLSIGNGTADSSAGHIGIMKVGSSLDKQPDISKEVCPRWK